MENASLTKARILKDLLNTSCRPQGDREKALLLRDLPDLIGNFAGRDFDYNLIPHPVI